MLTSLYVCLRLQQQPSRILELKTSPIQDRPNAEYRSGSGCFGRNVLPKLRSRSHFKSSSAQNYIPIVSKQINPTPTENHLQENKLTMMPPTRLLSTFVSSSSMRVTAQQSRSLSSQSNVAAQKLKNALEEYRRLQ